MIASQQHNALLVADHPKWTKSAQHLFESMHFHVTVALDTEHARGLLGTEHPEIVFIGLRLPRGSAYELCELIRRDPRLSNTRIIILGDKTYPEDIAFAEESGADAFLGWPLSDEELSEVINRLVSGTAETTKASLTE